MNAADEYQQAVTDLNETFKSGLRAFAKWCAENYGMSDTERREQKFSADYQRGWNAAMDAVDGALDLFLDEYHQ